MGILNVTPDSFSDGGHHATFESAVAHGESMLAAGADIIDVGGESTRPGAEPVPEEEESRRVIPVVAALAGSGATVSIDTAKPKVAAEAIAAGAVVVNDVTGLSDGAMRAVCAETEVGVVIMHMAGTPRTMQDDPVYADVVGEVHSFLMDRAAAAIEAGVAADRICIDPGIGFGKTTVHNLELLGATNVFASSGYPVLIGTSRKRFLGQLTGSEAPEERDDATNVTTAMSAAYGASVVRVHNVGATRRVLRIADAIVRGRTEAR